jgi:nucleoside-diphosphate-sugar epimerase
MRVLIIGYGYVGLPLGRLLVEQGQTVFGLRRTGEADAAMAADGIMPIHGDITTSIANLDPHFDAVINLVSSSKGGVDDYRRVYLEGTRNILRWLSQSPPRTYIYTSSTSVYAQTDGSWVSEESAAEPDSPTSQVLIETEQELLRQSAIPATILRASGIYGPERGHVFKQFLRGEAMMRDDGESWINMIHVDDVAGAIAHLLESNSAPGVYNLSDDEPVTQRQFFAWLASKLNRLLPPSALADPQRKRGLTNKRVSNAKLKVTGYNFIYPTYREGYLAEMRRLGVPVSDFP